MKSSRPSRDPAFRRFWAAALISATLVSTACTAAPSTTGSSTASASASASAAASTVPADLADAWKFMQQQMPGVPLSVLEAAKAEGSLMLYAGTWTKAQNDLNAGFEKVFPFIKVQEYTASTGQRDARWLAEEKAGRHVADVIQETDVGTFKDFVSKGLIAKYKISNAADYDPDVSVADYGYPLRVGMVGIAWNTNLVSADDAKVLSSWKGIADPRWKGRAAIVDPSAGGVAYLPWYAWTKQYGDGFIGQVAANKPRVFPATNPASAALASGDVAVIFNASETGLLPLQEKGAPIRWSLPSPGVGPPTLQAISATAPHPNAARLFQEYSFTKRGYPLWQKAGGAPARLNYQDERPIAKESWYKMPSKMFSYEPAAATAAQDHIIQLVHQEIGKAG